MKKISNTAIWVFGLVLTMMFSSIALAAVPFDFRDLVKAAGPAVVNINTERTEQVRATPPGFDMFRGAPNMERFFEHFDDFYGAPRTRKSSSLGSGFIISADGYIVTNNHVVEGADSIRVSMGRLGKEDTYAAQVIGTDPVTDLALIKIDVEGLPVLEFGDSDAVEVGEWVIAIGSPLGLDHTVTAGIISAKGRSLFNERYVDFLQTDASINQGNSGGPLLSMDGKVIGINTAIARQAQGIGFAIPSSMAQKIIDSLREHRKVSRGWLGVTIQNVDAVTAKALGLDNPAGALVNGVLEGQPAEQAGVRSGDIILSIDGKDIPNIEQLVRIVADIQPGTKVPVVIWREGKRQHVELVVTERGGNQASGKVPGKSQDMALDRLGLKLRPVTQDDLNRQNLSQVGGLFVTGIADEGLAAEAGIMPGDVILAVNNVRVDSMEAFSREVAGGIQDRGALLLHISRKGQIFFRGMEVKE